jgi:hypothetical protein
MVQTITYICLNHDSSDYMMNHDKTETPSWNSFRKTPEHQQHPEVLHKNQCPVIVISHSSVVLTQNPYPG